jgi:hypothetical protein
MFEAIKWPEDMAPGRRPHLEHLLQMFRWPHRTHD